ncbi:MAG TPA: nitrilase-related carbon-nitrogen hydrolase, partial [Pirellulales bacterium]|nr:nitrilase-related carbon-nitrogen hydrolase [Pirellulales bacterium]
MAQSHYGSSPSKVSIALVQMTCVREKEPNVRKTLARIGEAAAAGAQIVCLQELFAGEYFCQSEDHARFGEA